MKNPLWRVAFSTSITWRWTELSTSAVSATRCHGSLFHQCLTGCSKECNAKKYQSRSNSPIFNFFKSGANLIHELQMLQYFTHLHHPSFHCFKSSDLKVFLTSVKLIPNLVSSLISSAFPKQRKNRIHQSASISEFSEGVVGKVKKSYEKYSTLQKFTSHKAGKPTCLNREIYLLYLHV